MRRLIRVIRTDLEGVQFIALNYFDQHGQHADQVVKPVEDELDIIDTIMDVMDVQRAYNVDMETDDEIIFKTFHSLTGVHCSFVSSAELAALYDVLHPNSLIFPMLQELYLSQITEDDDTTNDTRPNIWRRFLIWLQQFKQRVIEFDSISKVRAVLRARKETRRDPGEV